MKKMKPKRSLIVAIIIGVLSVLYWSYRNFAIQKELQKLSDLIFQAAQPFMNESDFLTFKFSISVAPVAMKLAMWHATINGAMIAFSCVFIYCKIKKFRERKDALNSDFVVAKPE